MKIVYSKESKHEGNDCIIYDSGFVVEVESGYVVCINTIYRGWMGFNSNSQSFVYDNKEEAIKQIDEKLKEIDLL